MEPNTVDYERLKSIACELLLAIGENPERPGLKDTPRRWADFWREFIEYDPGRVDTTFEAVETDQMVVVNGMKVWSLCVPGKQLVNAVSGAKPARSVHPGDQLWTLHNGRVVPTTVTEVSSHRTHDVVEVITDEGKFKVTGDHPLATPDGWVEARDAAGLEIEWTNPLSLCRKRYTPVIGYDFGYTLGAVFSDGTVGDRCLSLVVNEQEFAQQFQTSLHNAFGPQPAVEPVTRPSGFLKREVPGFRVRVVSSYLADLFRQYAGGDAHHMRQQFPRVALSSLETFQGFLDGYVEGDGFRPKGASKAGRIIASCNAPFLQELATVIGARFTPGSRESNLYVADSWLRKHGFRQEDHETTLQESKWVRVREVRPAPPGRKPYNVYSFTCEPYPTFLVAGHLTHNCEHHLLPFWCDVTIGYIARNRILGLSKFGRVAHEAAHRLQLQEQMAYDIADRTSLLLGTDDVAVLLRGQHLCMTMRGIKTPSIMTTSVLRGAFREKSEARAEFFSIALQGGV